ncbi:MAG: iron-sulfur cluster assembly accessory protein [Planctomycetes bacterium]|nr:iron-sulfur cluster assembly accessory protein [Planctomycetota bacterium]
MAITLSDRAAVKVREILAERGLPETAGLRFAIKGGGCSGFEYVVDLVTSPRKFDMPSRHDKVFVTSGTRLLVDKKSLLFLDGTEIDWEEQEFGHSFTYTNPNASGTCGCGTSFSV